MAIEIIPARLDLLTSFREALNEVAHEHCYIEMVEAPAIEKLLEFQKALLDKNYPNYYAVEGAKVVGWCDISVPANPRLAHRGFLGMGLRADYRGRGLGRQLIEAALAHARRIGLEKVELTVYTSNKAAVGLYERVGFEREGLIRNYRQLDGTKYDCLQMAKTFATTA